MAAGRTQQNRDTEAELRVRDALIAADLADFLTHKTIPLPRWAGRNQRTTPDVLFPDDMIAIFVDGCWWHGCPKCFHDSRTNTAAWRGRAVKQRARDQRHSRCLETLGWRVLRIWEHQDADLTARAVRAIMDTNADPGTYGIPE